MKRAKSIFFLNLLALFILAGCDSKNEPESQAFLNKIIAHFSANQTPIPLSSLTDFKWDRVCSLYADDSNPYSVKNWIKEKTGKEVDVSKHAKMAWIFTTSDLKIKFYVFENSSFEINHHHHYLISVTDSGDNYGEVCFDVSEAKLKYASGRNGVAIELIKEPQK